MPLFKELDYLRKRRAGRWAIGVGSCALLLAAAFGGFQRAGAKAGGLTVSGAGATLHSDAFSVTPVCAWASDRRPGQSWSAVGQNRYLMLRARVVNRSRDWVAMRAYLDKDVVWLPAGAGGAVWPERSQRADDASTGLTLGPDLPVMVDFVWTLPAAAALPTRSTWGMFKRRHVERTYASGEAMWVQEGPGWKFELPVGRVCEGGPK